MDEDKKTRKIAKNWRERLEEFRESARVCKWVWHELIGQASKSWAKSMIVALAAGTILYSAQPWIIGFILTGLINKNGQLIIIGMGSLLACMLLHKICNYWEMTAKEWIFGVNAEKLEQRTTDLFMEKSLGQHIQENTVLSAANIEKGRNRVMELENVLLFEGFPVLFELFISYLFLWLISPVAGSAITILLMGYLAFGFYLNQKVMEVCVPIDKEFRKLNRHRVERWDKIERVKTCGKESEEVATITSWIESIIERDRNFWLWVVKIVTIRGLANIIVHIIVIGYGAYKVWHGNWEVGLLYPLFSWSSHISNNLWRISYIEHRINWAIPPVQSMMKALTLKPDIVDKENAIELISHDDIRIEFAYVSHTYPLAGREEVNISDSNTKLPQPVIKNVSFKIDPGDKVALIGSSGAGKTTIMRLLQRYMDPDYGSIKINGIDLRDLQLSSWIKLISYVPQQAQIFDGTIRDNLVYGPTPEERERISNDTLWDLVRSLQIDFRERLTNGLDTVVGKNGVKLSGGESQRVMIGAAALKKPKFMIIDEATSSLDSTTEKAVQKGLAKVLDQGIGALIITHRLSAVRNLCNKFIVLRNIEYLNGEDSQVEAIASSFEELYLISPTFRQLADDQEVIIKKQ